MNDERFKELFSEEMAQELKRLEELEVSAPTHEFSEGFEKRMKRTVKNGRRHYPVINTAFRQFACSAAVLALVIGAYFPVRATCETIYNYVVERVEMPAKEEAEKQSETKEAATEPATAVSTEPVEAVVYCETERVEEIVTRITTTVCTEQTQCTETTTHTTTVAAEKTTQNVTAVVDFGYDEYEGDDLIIIENNNQINEGGENQLDDENTSEPAENEQELPTDSTTENTGTQPEDTSDDVSCDETETTETVEDDNKSDTIKTVVIKIGDL